MSVFDRWFGSSRDEIFEEALAAFDRADYEEASEAFGAFLREDADAAEL
jgi:hypothetical protein